MMGPQANYGHLQEDFRLIFRIDTGESFGDRQTTFINVVVS